MPLSTVDVFGVPCEPIQQEEDVSAARDPVTNPGPFLQQTFLPHKLAAADARVQILGLLVDQIGFREKIRHTCRTPWRCDLRGSRPPGRQRKLPRICDRTWGCV